MAKFYDLSSYLEEKKATIKLGEETFEINDGFNDLLKIDALSARKEELGTSGFVQEFLKIALGNEKAEVLISRNYSTKVYVKIMNCIQEVYSGDDEQEGDSQPETTGELV